MRIFRKVGDFVGAFHSLIRSVYLHTIGSGAARLAPENKKAVGQHYNQRQKRDNGGK